MALILNIDTSVDSAIVCASENGQVVAVKTNSIQKEHASFIHVSIGEIIKEMGIKIQDFSAIAVAEGPGSYTGLRVGLSSAKGFCYALNKPLILISSLEIIAQDIITHTSTPSLFCPMIDARRMEVYTSLYDADLKEIHPPSAVILHKDYLIEYLADNRIVCSGNGAEKFHTISNHSHLFFQQKADIPLSISQLSYNLFTKKSFSDIAHSTPKYLKNFVNFS